MSKKNAPQQLQTDITNDEDLDKFMQKEGLLLLEVYTGWCGPCVSMLSALKKIKLEKGGEDLVLATVRADEVQTFARLQNKSEPTWLLAVNGKLCTGMFGSNVPRLLQMISDEIDAYRRMKEGEPDSGRRMYELTEMVPCEQERYDARKAIEDRNAQMAIDTAAGNRIAYITQVFNDISDRLPDFGVTVMQPHCLNKDIIKQVPIVAEKFGLTVKDKKLVQMAVADLELLHFECSNRLPQFALDALFAKEAYMVAWKKADAELQPVETILRHLVDALSLPQPIKGDPSEEPVRVPPVLRALQLQVSKAVWDEYQEWEVTEDRWTRERLRSFEAHRLAGEGSLAADDASGNAEEGGETPAMATIVDAEGAVGESEEKNSEGGVSTTGDGDELMPKAADGDSATVFAENVSDPEAIAEEPVTEEPIELFTVDLLPIWTPANKEAQAALIYMYFRNLTDHFLPPDPQPDPPHVAIVFDAFKRHELMAQIEATPADILAYGYFTAEQPETASLLATSTYKYERLKKKSIADRMVLKVSKKTSHTLLALTSQVPCYVSMNTVEGELDCRKFFPDGYKMSSETGEDEEQEEDESEQVPTGTVADEHTDSIPTETQDDGIDESPPVNGDATADGNLPDNVAGGEAPVVVGVIVEDGNVENAK